MILLLTAAAAADAWQDAASCGQCHRDEHTQWQASRHRVSWSNALFQSEYADAQDPLCVSCHAPLVEQVQAARHQADHPALAEGITCVTCHLRSGQIQSTTISGEAPHPSVAAPTMGTADFCASCHEFGFPHWEDGGLRWRSDTLMQSTVTEHAQWGGTQSCQDCHMTAGSHRFPGAHDLALLRGSVAVEIVDQGAELAITLSTIGVGHAFPTGDIFRHLTFEVDTGSGWQQLLWLGRRFEERWDPTAAAWLTVEHSDSRLHPGQPIQLTLPPEAALVWRLRYHYTQEDAPAIVLADGTHPETPAP